MEKLKNYVREHLSLDERYSLQENFDSFLDNATIYYSACKEFYEINPIKCIELAQMNGEQLPNPKDLERFITYVARNALTNLVYNYMYTEFEEQLEKLILKTLPKKVSFALSKLDYEETDLEDSYNMSELICDYLSNTYGHCVNDFDYKIKDKKVYCTNIEWDVSE